MLKTLQGKLLAVLAAVGLGSGVLVVLNSDGCTVKPAAPVADAGVTAGGEGEGELVLPELPQ